MRSLPMQPSELLQMLSRSEDPELAAKVLAAQCRSKLCGSSLWGDASLKPLTTDALIAIGKLSGIAELQFGVPLASEGAIVPLPTGGFSVSIARPRRSNRARYTLAHEIAHTFFYDATSKPPVRLTPYNASGMANREVRAATALEERFCDAFAAEILFPAEAAKLEMGSCTRIADSSELLAFLEDLGPRWGISVELALRHLNRAYGLDANRNRVISVLRWRPNAKTGRDPAARITQSFPRPCGRWFLPPNIRASSIGLSGASILFEWWDKFEKRELGREYRRYGVANLKMESGKPTVLLNERSVCAPYIENLLIWKKPFLGARWQRVNISTPVTYRFYGINPREAYMVALMDFTSPEKVENSPHSTNVINPIISTKASQI